MKYIDVTDFMIELEDFIYDSYRNSTENIGDNFNFSIDITSNDCEKKIIGLEYKIQSLDKELFDDVVVYFYKKYQDDQIDIQAIRRGELSLNVEINTFINAFKPHINNNFTLRQFFEYMEEWINNYSSTEEIPIADIFGDYKSEKFGNKSHRLIRKMSSKNCSKYNFNYYKA